MILNNSFIVPAPVDEVWQLFLDVERVAPCMPGATLDSIDGDEFSGRIRVKLGAIQMTYRMKGRFTEKNEEGRRLVIEGAGKESRGAGTVKAAITLTLEERGGSTEVTVSTDMNITGKPAQFGRGALEDIGGKILAQFAKNLENLITADDTPEPAPAAPPAGSTAPASAQTAPSSNAAVRQPQQEAEPLDLMGVIGPSPDRIVAVVSSVIALVLAVLLLRKK